MNLFDVLQWLAQFIWANPQLVIVLLIGGSIILYVFNTAKRRANQGGVAFWAMLFTWLFFLGGAIELVLLLFLIFRGGTWVTQGVFDLLEGASADARTLVLPPLTPSGPAEPIGGIPGGFTFGSTAGGPTVEPTLPAAPSSTFYKEFGAPIEVKLLPGVASLTLFDWKDNSQQSVSSGPFYACAVTNGGWLVACPATDLVVFSPNDVDIATAGITLPPTPSPTATPTQSVAETCQPKFIAWTKTLAAELLKGTDLVPEGIAAEVTGGGVPVFIPAYNTAFTITATGLPGSPSFVVGEDQVKGIPGVAFNTATQFIGTGNQCK